MDQIMSLWVPRKEGKCPTHFVVLRQGHIFCIEPLIGDEPWTAPELERAFQKICDEAEHLRGKPTIAALTRDPRDTWAVNREYLMKLDPTNLKSLEKIESAMFVVVLDEEEPRSQSEVCQKLMTGIPINRWADKSLSVIQFANGHGGVNCDHTPIDAMVTVVMSYFIHLGITDMGGKWPLPEPANPRKLKEPQLLTWKIDQKLEAAINLAKENAHKLNVDIVLKRKPFKGFGKIEIQKLKVNPDTFVQMALQLAYYRLHGKPAPTYETATTRKYRQGRTETLRSCSNEAVAFIRQMDKNDTDVSTKRQLLKTALSTHDRLMKEAKEGFGCDRHLMGLSILVNQAGPSVSEIPAIKSFFSDPAFFKSGGGGNYVLSTSTSGYTAMSGGATAMVTDGYGVFYNFEPHQIWAWITNFRRSFETSAEKFDAQLEKAFYDMMSLLASEKSKI